jgi:uncharacterized membrane protein
MKTPLQRRRRSIRQISDGVFRGEFVRASVAEVLLFGILAVIAIWPMLQAAEAICALGV